MNFFKFCEGKNFEGLHMTVKFKTRREFPSFFLFMENYAKNHTYAYYSPLDKIPIFFFVIHFKTFRKNPKFQVFFKKRKK